MVNLNKKEVKNLLNEGTSSKEARKEKISCIDSPLLFDFGLEILGEVLEFVCDVIFDSFN